MLIEAVPFTTLGKLQPFLITISSSALLLADFHCHLTMHEVCGYLAGSWDVNSHSEYIFTFKFISIPFHSSQLKFHFIPRCNNNAFCFSSSLSILFIYFLFPSLFLSVYIYLYRYVALSITKAYPCRSSRYDRSKATEIERTIQKSMIKDQLLLVGWYHSHPKFQAEPTLRDCDAQLDYQIRMRGPSDATYTPCVALVIC